MLHKDHQVYHQVIRSMIPSFSFFDGNIQKIIYETYTEMIPIGQF